MRRTRFIVGQFSRLVVALCFCCICAPVIADTPSTVGSNFNGTPIASGDYVWFISVLKPPKIGSQAVTIFVRNSSIQFAANGTSFTVPVPNANITLDPSATAATTSFNASDNAWHTTLPGSGLAGNALMDAVAFPVPAGGLPGGIQNVKWLANFSADTAGVSIQWMWSAAVYTSFNSDYNGLGVKPVDDNKASQYQNSDHAGTPENFKVDLTAGATGGGGSNYTGGLSGTVSVAVPVNQFPTANAGGPYSATVGQAISFSGSGSSDPDGDQLTYSWNFGDGTTGTGDAPTHAYQASGTYAVALTVNDGRNGTATVTTSASTTMPAPPPPPTITAQISPAPNAQGWNNSPVTVSFVCKSSSSTISSCTSPITVSAEGAGQVVTGTATDAAGNSASTSVSLNIDLTPPVIVATTAPSLGWNGWSSTAVTVSFRCSDSISGVAHCPGPETLTTEGASQTVTGTATDVAGNSGSSNITLNIDETPPTLIISSPTNGATVSSSDLTVSGSVSDSLSGVGAVACNGSQATISNSSFTCNLTLVNATNSIDVQMVDIAGNATSATVSVSYDPVLDPPPTSVFITPDTISIATSETRTLHLVDNLGRILPASSWTISDPTVAHIASDSTITPLTSGTVTITGTYQGFAATAQLTVYNSQTLPPGTIHWSVQPMPGDKLTNVVAGEPNTLDGADAYFLEQDASSDIIVRAFTSDGRQLWVHSIVPPSGATSTSTSMISRPSSLSFATAEQKTTRGHKWGKKITAFLNQMKSRQHTSGTLATQMATPAATGSGDQTVLSSAVTDAGNLVVNIFTNLMSDSSVDNIIVLDQKGNELWRHSIFGGEEGYALHPDGIVYILQADYINNSTFTLFAFEETTGTQRFSSIQLPFSFGGQLQPFPGLPSVLTDGNLYLAVETVPDAVSPDSMSVLKVTPNGTYSWFPVAKAAPCAGPVIEPHEVLPDAQGGLLVTWDYFPSTQSCYNTPPAQVTHFSNSDTFLENFVPPLDAFSSYFSDNDGDGVTGQKDLFLIGFPCDPSMSGCQRNEAVVGLNMNTGSVDVNWQPTVCSGCSSPQVSIVGISSGDQVIVNENDGSQASLLTLSPPAPGAPTAAVFAIATPSATLTSYDFYNPSPLFGGLNFGPQPFLGIFPNPPAMIGFTGGSMITNVSPRLLSEWPEVAMSDTREGIIQVKLNIFRICPDLTQDMASCTADAQSLISDSAIKNQVTQAQSIWGMKAHIRLDWDGTITQVPQCAPDLPQCDEFSISDVFDVTAGDANTPPPTPGNLSEVYRRFQQPRGAQLVFVQTVGSSSQQAVTYANGTDSSGNLIFTNVSALGHQIPTNVMAHELGHEFGLEHIVNPFNLMCGSTGSFISDVGALFCPSSPAVSLNDSQIKAARTGAMKWQ